MSKAIRVHEYGAPKVMQWENAKPGKPKKGEVLVRHHAVGLNYIDTYFRSGAYKAPALPFTPGNEGAGEVLALGAGVTGLKVGDRVAYAGPLGSYSEERTMPADRLVKIPDNVSYELAASIMLKGMTAQYLLRRTFRVKKGDTILFHAAAGGVGLMACQWANALGATVIGTVGSKEKAKLAKAHGCHHVINYREKDFVEQVRRITRKEGVDVVYDGVGKDTFPGSLDCIKPLGMWVLFGAASGPVPPLDLQMLAARGSLFTTRPTLFSYIAKREDLVKTARELFKVVGDETVKVEINQRYKLKDAAKAHRDLEGRKTTGASVLLP